MDIKDLNKVQLILLALLLSFVTSIATGITTVTLMQQAPPSVTVPINRIIQQTVEKVVPIEGKTTVETVIIKEEDLVVEAIAMNQGATFSVSKEIRDQNNQEVEVDAGFGVAVSNAGFLAVDAVLVPGEGKYFVENSSGKFNADFVAKNESGFSFLKIGTALSSPKDPEFSLPKVGDLSQMKRGQKVIVLGENTNSFIFEGGTSIKLNTTQSMAGGLVLNLAGEVLGMALLNDQKTFVSIKEVNEAFSSLKI